MIILSNCLTDVVDEGCLKVANSLAERVKQVAHDTTVVSFHRRSRITDIYLEVNKFLLSKDLIRLIRERRESILYIPFPTRSLPTAFRILFLSLISPQKVDVLLTMTRPYGTLSRLLLRLSRAHLFVLSAESARFYTKLVGEDRVTYLQAGVDLNRFAPVSPERVAELKRKYGLDPDRKTVLHVGHMKAGRNIAALMHLDSHYQVLLIVSTFTSSEQDCQLRRQLEKRENIKIIDSYIPNIEEIYQLADIYFFPVLESGNCIDVPLSCLEAAACGKPVITTRYGEMREFEEKDGFFLIDGIHPEELNDLVSHVTQTNGSHPRNAVLEYDWNHAVRKILKQ